MFDWSPRMTPQKVPLDICRTFSSYILHRQSWSKNHTRNLLLLLYSVRSALYEPDAPPVKVIIFFSKEERFIIGRIFWAEFALKSRGFGGFGKTSDEVIYVKSFVRIPVRGLGSVSKIYQAKRMCQRRSSTARWRPILRRQTESTVWSKAAWRNDGGFKIRQEPYT